MRTSENFTHGSSGYINYGCGCEVCREGHRIAMSQARARRRARTKANGGVAPIAKHDNSTYTNWGCECDVCAQDHALLAAMNNSLDCKRRSFTLEYKRQILADYDETAHGRKAILLRREGLRSGHIAAWRKQLSTS